MKYMSLDQRGTVQAEYIWIDAVGGCRSKTRVCTFLYSLDFLYSLHACGAGRCPGLRRGTRRYHGSLEHR